MTLSQRSSWLPAGRSAAICFSVDDVHPGRSTDAYEAGGDLERGALGHIEWLLDRHPDLRVTLFTTADWREISPLPTRRLRARLPVLRDRSYLAPILPEGTMRLDRHPDFVRYLSSLPRTEVALHGLHHIHHGPRVTVEFQHQSRSECIAILERAMGIFEEAGLPRPEGMTPPGWEASPSLLGAMADLGLRYVASSRDVRTAVAPDAKAAMSGLQGVDLFASSLVVDAKLVHIPTNFQATSTLDRAIAVLEMGGLLSIKAHIVKNALGTIALDGLDELYRNYLDVLFDRVEAAFGEELWWATCAEVAEAVHDHGESVLVE